MKLDDTTRPLREPASALLNSCESCVEVLGGNELRTEALLVAGLEILLVARPAGAEAGGDIYCIHSCSDRAMAKIVLLDITGHGERSAHVARRVHRLLHRYSTDTQPGRLLTFLNQQFSDFAPAGTLATSLCAVYKSGRGELHYAYGGQPRILFWRAEHRQWTTLAPSQESICGLPFGVTMTACYDEDCILLHPADVLLMFSDGVLETRSAAGKLLEPDGVMELARGSTEEVDCTSYFALTAVADAFLRRLGDFHGSPDFQDDITLLWIRRFSGQRPKAFSP